MLFAALMVLAAQATTWQQPPDDILEVLHAPDLPRVWTAPGGGHLLLADGVYYPPLAELAAPMHELAGVRVDPLTNGFYNRQGATSPRLLRVRDGEEIGLPLPAEAQVLGVIWTADGERFALGVKHADRIGLWVGSVDGRLEEIEGLALNPLLGSAWDWMPDQRRLLVKAVPGDRGPAPEPPPIPAGPETRAGDGDTARSTYEARNLLRTIHDEALFEYYGASQLVLVDPVAERLTPLGKPALYSGVSPSPDGRYILVERLLPPWSHEAAWWRFAHDVEMWSPEGRRLATIARIPLADAVPVHGVPTGPRDHAWRATAPHTLYWVEALDGGDPMAEVEHRDRIMRLKAPFTGEPEEVFRAEHRARYWSWTAAGDTLMLVQRERERRWKHVWLVDVARGEARPWYDLSEKERYADPGSPVYRPLANGRWVLHQRGDAVYFAGNGSSPEGDRPFLDLRDLRSGQTERLFRCDPRRYERFIAFAGDGERLLIRSESAAEVPNYQLVTLGDAIEAAEGEARRTRIAAPITHFDDPTPQLRQISKRIVRYAREDGVALSFNLHLPPGYREGTRLPTVLYAYPLEYSDAGTAGQVEGSSQRFDRFYGASHMFFLLRGYAVLDDTAMPMIGDPETTYDTFVPQLVADARAAVARAVEMGVADPKRIGVIGHSHGGLMVANLLAHTDLFAAGIARSGSYNKTVQPFGFQNERRSLFEARDAYIQLSPTFFADRIDEPILLIHGAEDANPGTRTYQSEVLFEAVRGTGGTARLVLLPHEDHGYRARENIEHVLWEQLEWFDRYVKMAGE